MKAVAELIIAVADLVEAESRQMRKVYIQTRVFNFALAVLAMFSAAGVGLVFWATYRVLNESAGPVLGSFLTGVVILMTSGGLLWTIKRVTQK